MLRYMRDNVAQNKFVRRVSNFVNPGMRDSRYDIFRLIFRRVIQTDTFGGRARKKKKKQTRTRETSGIIKLIAPMDGRRNCLCVSAKRKKRCIPLAAAGCFRRIRPGWPKGAFFVSEIFSECIDSRLGIRNGVLRNLIIRHRQLSREPFFAGTGCVVVFRLSIGK